MMGPVDPELTSQFARSCTDAAFGYARAASAAYAAMASQTISFWTETAQGRVPADPPKTYSVYRPRPDAAPMVSGVSAIELMQLMNPWFRPESAFASVRAWLGLFPLQGNPASWPMAYSMMTAGVPRDVALPTAEANVAVIEAADIAKQSLARIFSSYQTDGGHATAHIKFSGPDDIARAWLWPWGIGRT